MKWNKIRNTWTAFVHPGIGNVLKKRLTYLSALALKELGETVRKIDKDKVQGLFLEAGSAYGGSAIYISSLKKDSRQFKVYDMFGMIPPPSDNDGDAEHERYRQIVSGNSKGIRGDNYYGYEHDLKKIVERNFKEFGVDIEKQNIELIEGKFQETMHINEAVALAHIDCDWYDSVYYCLEQIMPHLSPGGVIILDDYYHWDSCKKATQDYLKQYTGSYRIYEGERYQIWKPKQE